MIDREKIGVLLKEAIGCRIRNFEIITEILEMIAGPDAPEAENIRIENAVQEYIDDWALDSETAEGIGIEDANALLEQLET